MPYSKESQLDRLCRFCTLARADMFCLYDSLIYVYYKCVWVKPNKNSDPTPRRLDAVKDDARFQSYSRNIISCDSFTPKEGG